VDILARLSPSYWWADPGTTIGGPFVVAFAIVLAVAFVGGIAVWILAPRLAPEVRPTARAIERFAKWTVALAAVGLLLLLFRWQIVPFFSKRLWMFLWMAAVVGGAAYVVYYARRVHPERILAWEDSHRRRRYLPRPAQGRRRSRRRR
jgi:hypothetical protein